MPNNLLCLANNDINIALIAGRAVVIETLAELTIAANHMRRFHVNARGSVMGAAASAADFRHRNVDMTVLRVIHEHNVARQSGADDCAGNDNAIAIINFAPVVIFNDDFSRILFIEPNRLPVSEQRQKLLTVEIH